MTFLIQDVGANIGMYAVVIAAMGRRVVAVDADPENLAYIRKSLDLAQNTQYVDIIYNSVRYVGVNKKSIMSFSVPSDEYETLYPHAPDGSNEGGTHMLTKEQVEQENIVTQIPPLNSVLLEDVLNYIHTEVVILKIDVESYECKALQPNILQNKIGKFIPYIFMEWGQLPNNNITCPHFNEWVLNFYTGGYIPVNPSTLMTVTTEERDKMWDIAWVHSSVK